MVSMLLVQNRIAHQKVKKRIVSRRNGPAHIRFIRIEIADEKFSLSDKLFRQIGDHVANSIDEVQVGMQPDLISTNDPKKVNPYVFRQSLQFRTNDIVSGQPYVDKHGGIVTPDTIIDSLHEGIVRVPHSQSMNPGSDFLAAHQSPRDDCHNIPLSSGYRIVLMSRVEPPLAIESTRWNPMPAAPRLH
jgi:hypothetical protein